MNRTFPTLGAVAACALLLASCASGSLASSETTPSGPGSAVPSAASTSGGPTIAGPTLVVTVPELALSGAGTAPVTVAPTTDAATPDAPSPTVEAPAADPTPTDAGTPVAPEPATQAPAPAPSGDGLNVSLANCDGCSVVATHRDVAGGRSAALVGTGSGRALLLSVGSDGQVAGVIGVPYGVAFPAPADGVLPCAQGRCVVQGRQADGRAMLSAFELTGSGAWRDVSGDDAFPSATERSAVVDLDGELAIAVQDQAAGAAVWMLYTWGGDRYAVLGCAPDGDPPSGAADVSPTACLS
ncbi:hypothetical protein [Nakamurella sp.]|uniref:hypothetical protein n=1 Tax=Nakamurella sp. TaxID=1869182 RepID=UPI0037843114